MKTHIKVGDIKMLKPKYERTNRMCKEIVEMMKENTGVHMMDSGGAYGRNWERNQDFSFATTKEAELSISSYGIEVTINVAHWLKDNFAYPEAINKIYKAFCENSEDNHLADMGKFVYMLQGLTDCDIEWFSENSYNRDSLLSQVIQYIAFEVNEEMAEKLSAKYSEVISEEATPGYYALISLHNGCDVRGGYTRARIFQMEELYDIYRDDSYTIQCDAPYVTHPDLFEDHDTPISRPHVWYGQLYDMESDEDGILDLNKYEISDNPDNRGKGIIYYDEDDVGYCPICGAKLNIYTN
jgi:hypothetical protein